MSMTNPMIPAHLKPKYKKGTVLLKRHVLLGTNATILPGITLEEGVAIGAHSLVTKHCKEWSVYFGNPAKRIKKRNKKPLQLERQLINDLKSINN
jgi:galactoside O-acetyltransferase